ncbi:hypothetical protein AAFC00_006063 [Neodothiora populina]|uniref:alpha-1,2-Mannosidase n=1 Tax=Neodothiora populina TaxID=2781224 RepID=A0ABR3P7J9_9PEZI
MLSLSIFVLSASLVFPYRPAIALPQRWPIRYSNSSTGVSPQDRANAVKVVFETAWDGYYKYAFPNDELYPVNNSFGNSRNGWGASAVDAITTAILMQNGTIVDEILAHIPEVDFGVSYHDEIVSVFETTIRYLGGMLSAYDLLTGPFSGLASNSSQVDALLSQSINLANALSYAFETPTGVPTNNLIFGNRSDDGSETNGIATIGTLVLEWTRLSDLTGNTTYAELAQRAESYLLEPMSAPGVNGEPWPGLVGTDVNITTGQFTDGVGGWNGGGDSFYEYLIKAHVYDSTRFSEYKDRWVLAAQSTMDYLGSHPSSRPDITFIAAYNETRLKYDFSHLGCFAGGNFILGGQLLNNTMMTTFGLEVTAGCHETYVSTVTGIGPEDFSWTVTGGNSSAVPANQSDFYDANGFYITDSSYELRPEVIESYYYAYRATNDSKYQDWTWDAIQAINATTRVNSGYSEIADVDAAGGGGFIGWQDSFLFAEVLKYSYLIFTAGGPDEQFQVQGPGSMQGWVFNTEAHPLKVAGPQV